VFEFKDEKEAGRLARGLVGMRSGVLFFTVAPPEISSLDRDAAIKNVSLHPTGLNPVVSQP
jgi:hypothetical protein